MSTKSRRSRLSTAPDRPFLSGYVEGYTHDPPRHRHLVRRARHCRRAGHRHLQTAPFLDFLRLVDRNVPEELDIHLVADNYATHKHPKIRAAQRPRYHLHFTPTYASWLNQVERWFGLETALRRGSNVGDLVKRQFTKDYNRNAAPFVWAATADLEKVQRLSMRISGTEH